MILPAEFDIERPTDELVAEMASMGAYTEDEARAIVEMLKDPDQEPLE